MATRSFADRLAVLGQVRRARDYQLDPAPPPRDEPPPKLPPRLLERDELDELDELNELRAVDDDVDVGDGRVLFDVYRMYDV